MSYYFKMLSNIPGYGTSWIYSTRFKSTLQNEARAAERLKEVRCWNLPAVFLKSTFFEHTYAQMFQGLRGLLRALPPHFVNWKKSLKTLF